MWFAKLCLVWLFFPAASDVNIPPSSMLTRCLTLPQNTNDEDSMIVQYILGERKGKREVIRTTSSGPGARDQKGGRRGLRDRSRCRW